MVTQQRKLNWKAISKKGRNFEVLLIDCIAQAFVKNNKGKKKFGIFYPTAYRQYQSDRWMIEEDVDKFIKASKKKEVEQPGSILKSYITYEKMLNGLVRFARSIGGTNFSDYSNKQLVATLKEYFWLGGKPIIYGYNYYFYQYLGDELLSILDRKIGDKKKINNFFEIFTQATKLSYLQQSQKELLEFVGTMERRKLKITGVVVQEWIDSHLAVFAFMGMYYFRGSPWKKSGLVQRLQYWQKGDYSGELQKLKVSEKRRGNWRKHAKEIKLSQKEHVLVETIMLMTHCSNLYNEAWSQLTYNSRSLLSEVAQRLGVKQREFIQMTSREIIDTLSSGKSIPSKLRKNIQERKQESCYVMDGKVTVVLSGRQLAAYKSKENNSAIIPKKLNILQGQTASPGVVVGRVVKLRGVGQLSKVKRGDILVAKGTVPAFLPAMERAGAMVTETGGLLSHAAIVAREMGRPCVIGVENVMLLLKDGDKVEVDATNGIVRKI